jgi:hypothetical protein
MTNTSLCPGFRSTSRLRRDESARRANEAFVLLLLLLLVTRGQRTCSGRESLSSVVLAIGRKKGKTTASYHFETCRNRHVIS